jgi:hypothetical protein
VKINGLFIKLFVVLTLLYTAAMANTNLSGMLKSGNEIILRPHNGHALSITRTPGKYLSKSSYDFIMINGDEIIYEDRNQVDDVYLIFHDDVQEGDRIKIHVNRGYFDYKIKPLQALPTIVKEVIEPEVLERAKRERSPLKEHKKRDVKKRTKKVESKKKALVPAVVPQEATIKPIIEPSVETKVKKSNAVLQNATTPSPVSESFFARFTQIFKDLVKSFSLTPISTPKESNKLNDKKVDIKEKKSTPPPKKPLKEMDKRVVEKGIKEHFDDSLLQQAATPTQGLVLKDRPKGVSLQTQGEHLQQEARIEESTFSKPKRGIGEDFSDQALQSEAKILKRNFTPQQPIVVDSTLHAQIEEKFQGLKREAPAFKSDKISKKIESVPSFKPTSTLAKEPDFQEMKTLAKENIPAFQTVQPQPSAVTNVTERAVDVAPIEEPASLDTIKKIPETTPSVEDKRAAYPDTGYKEGYETLNQQPKPLKSVTTPKPLPPVMIDETLPQKAEPRVDEEKRLVITKRIDKKEPQADPFAGRVLGHMDDRVLGTGYNGAATSAKLGVRVSKNRRPVSAWIEVFKNGTKQRVKTFYTSKTSKTKSVKLPAGNYMVRATYRTRGSKQQKTIKNIHLAEADSVTKNIAFYDGTLRVIARRGANPLYVKVIAYKSGTHRRVSYDFSSRTSGIAKLTLSSGTYDIEVLEHDKSRFFENVHIRGGKTKTINADF